MPTLRAMLSVKELRTLISSLDREKFKRQLGPFALVQRPPEEQLPKPAAPRPPVALGDNPFDEPESTAFARPAVISQGALSIVFQFEDLLVATLPPMAGVTDLTVGRLPDCDLVLDHPSVSKRHAVLVWDDEMGQCLVKDLGSRNGTYVNDEKLTGDATLRDGDVVSFGEAQFWFLLTESLHAKLAQRGGRS